MNTICEIISFLSIAIFPLSLIVYIYGLIECAFHKCFYTPKDHFEELGDFLGNFFSRVLFVITLVSFPVTYLLTRDNTKMMIISLAVNFLSFLCMSGILCYLPNEKRLAEWISWCCVKSSSNRRAGESLYWELMDCQSNDLIEKEYRVVNNIENRDFIDELLNHYQEELAEKYFDGALSITRKTYRLSSAQYFICSFNLFLGEHEHKDVLFDTNENKDLMITYHKLQYITTKLNPIADQEDWSTRNELSRLREHIKKYEAELN